MRVRCRYLIGEIFNGGEGGLGLVWARAGAGAKVHQKTADTVSTVTRTVRRVEGDLMAAFMVNGLTGALLHVHE